MTNVPEFYNCFFFFNVHSKTPSSRHYLFKSFSCCDLMCESHIVIRNKEANFLLTQSHFLVPHRKTRTYCIHYHSDKKNLFHFMHGSNFYWRLLFSILLQGSRFGVQKPSKIWILSWSSHHQRSLVLSSSENSSGQLQNFAIGNFSM